MTNRVEIDAEPVGTIRIAGPGAGGPETSSAVLADILALARGLGSTWAGLPQAGASESGPLSPDEVVAGPRHWYGFLPAVDRPERLPEALDEAAAVAFDDGTAIVSERVSLDEARAAFAALLPPGVDLTLYPCDD